MSSLDAAATPGEALTTVRHRRWVQRNDAVLPFVWHGMLPLLGLLGLVAFAFGPFAREVIESRVTQQVRSALNAAGHSWVQIAVSGQHVALTGTQPAAGAGDAALALARTTTCPTWTGPRVCAVDVVGRFGDPPAAPPAAPATAAAAPPTAASAAQACEKSLAGLLEGRRIEFASGSAVLLDKNVVLLDELARAARECPGTVRVEGHTDSVGSAPSNRVLSLARAEAVRRALIERGMSAPRLVAEGFGPDKPIASNTTAEGRAQNRRIEFRVAAGN